MEAEQESPRILLITPEVTRLPMELGRRAAGVSARAGGLGDICADLFSALYRRGVGVHLAIPNYRNLFRSREACGQYGAHDPAVAFQFGECVHLAQDRSFYYRPGINYAPDGDNIRSALAFQREVINRIIPEVKPDLVHCHDWMTALIPAMARRAGLPCLFTLYNLATARIDLCGIEARGIDAADFWQHCFFQRMPLNYEETRHGNPLDFLTSAVFAATCVNTVSDGFLWEMVRRDREEMMPGLFSELKNKYLAGAFFAIEHFPDASFDPAADKVLFRPYSAGDHAAAKQFNKLHLQETLGLRLNSRAPLFFWPTRLDYGRQGCWMTAGILPGLLERHAQQDFEIVFIADGDFSHHLDEVIRQADAADRVAVRPFDPRLQRLAYAAADFVLMPMRYEPCGLPAKIALRYGALPIAHNTGGLRGILKPLDTATGTGNAFLFDVFDTRGLEWCIGQAMQFFEFPQAEKERQVRRIMKESNQRDDHSGVTDLYMRVYEQMLHRPLLREAQANEHLDAA